MSLTKEIAQEACDILANEGHEATVYEDYSGRCMYGEKCVGIVTSVSGALVGWAITKAYFDLELSEAEDIDINEAIDIMDDRKLIKSIPTRSDSMGRDTIYY